MMSQKLERIEVKLSDRSYQILIGAGLRHGIGEEMRSALSERCRQAAVISNPLVFDLYGNEIMSSLERAGYRTHHFLIGDGERFKTLSSASKIFSFLIERQIERGDCIIALGGGVVGDLAGFAAAAYLRGIDCIQVPTTLLAQIDSSIGGKTGVNHPLGKNLIGAFHQPKLVVADTDALKTLAARELRAAMQEAVKYGVIADEALFELLESRRDEILSGDNNLLTQIVHQCASIKAGIVSRDERESGERRILNFGHTVGHALETVGRFKRFKHGEAIGYGIIAAVQIALTINLLKFDQAERIERLVRAFGPLPSAVGIDADSVLKAMTKDKKAVAGRLVFVLPQSIGRVIIREEIDAKVIFRALSVIL